MEKPFELIYRAVDKLVDMYQKGEELYLEIVCQNPKSLQNHLREKLKKYPEINDAVSIVRMGGTKVMVMPRPVSRQKTLERLLEKALPEIENEYLYDEIMEALYGNGQK